MPPALSSLLYSLFMKKNNRANTRERVMEDEYEGTPMEILFQIENAERMVVWSELLTPIFSRGSWAAVPSPCIGLEHALVSVWTRHPEDLGLLFERLGEEVQREVREVLTVLHCRLSTAPLEVKMQIFEGIWPSPLQCMVAVDEKVDDA